MSTFLIHDEMGCPHSLDITPEGMTVGIEIPTGGDVDEHCSWFPDLRATDGNHYVLECSSVTLQPIFVLQEDDTGEETDLPQILRLWVEGPTPEAPQESWYCWISALSCVDRYQRAMALGLIHSIGLVVSPTTP